VWASRPHIDRRDAYTTIKIKKIWDNFLLGIL
jgi:hypothetical protein